ncbi:O-antigen ligase family protein [Waterburya agarophytonicola K14]|uniref:O-antigen ligase family protein n=1 Tax=Waterburya agarophytonicola KI4 TaxID=2874699 RepID=A0A964BQA6_9CYAN|nr:O-antigen ligase family protein [Waterburya agarophytonicola]MCC0175955.1 O-antigen ligase family protein [Waterburya agarophytonicola KI4]
MKQSIRPFENIFTVISLLLFSNGFYPIILGNTVGEGDIDSPLLRMVFIGIYFVTLILLAFRWQRTLTILNSNLWLLFLLGLAVVSISWSSVPHIAFRKVVSLIGATLFGVYLSSRYNFEEQLKVYSWTFGIALFFSYIFALALPQYGIMNTDAIVGAWQGIFPHKNGLGEAMFVGFMTFYFSSIISKDRQKKLFFQVCCFLSVLIIYFGESATALMSVLFIFLTAQGLKRLSITSKKSVLILLMFSISTVIILFLFLANFNAFLTVNDKDVTLSGRTILWDTLWQFIREKPLLGYGYGSFFSGESREANLLWQIHDWSPVHSHNGYIQLWLNLGLVGLCVFTLGYFSCLFNSLFKYLVSKDLRMLWIFLFLIYTVFLNMTEVSFFSSSSIWIVALASIYSMKIKTQVITEKKVVAST